MFLRDTIWLLLVISLTGCTVEAELIFNTGISVERVVELSNKYELLAARSKSTPIALESDPSSLINGQIEKSFEVGINSDNSLQNIKQLFLNAYKERAVIAQQKSEEIESLISEHRLIFEKVASDLQIAFDSEPQDSSKISELSRLQRSALIKISRLERKAAMYPDINEQEFLDNLVIYSVIVHMPYEECQINTSESMPFDRYYQMSSE